MKDPGNSTSNVVNRQYLSRIFLLKMLYLVGLGLADETDITVKGLEVVKKAERVYLEAYTSILLVDRGKLVSGRTIPIVFLFIVMVIVSAAKGQLTHQ